MAGLGRGIRTRNSLAGDEIGLGPMRAPTKLDAGERMSTLRRAWKGVLSFLAMQVRQGRKSPVTVGLVAIWWVVGIVFGDLLEGPTESELEKVAAGVPSFQEGYWWTPVTSAFFATDLITYIGVTVLLLVAGSLFERRWGSLRMLWMTLLVQIVGVTVGVAVVAVGNVLIDG